MASPLQTRYDICNYARRYIMDKPIHKPTFKLVNAIKDNWNRYDDCGDVNVSEISNHQLRSYMDNVWTAVERGKKDLEDSIFFVVVTLKGEGILHKTLRNQFFYRRSCPTPTFQQTVFRYLRKDDMLEYLWSIPDPKSAYDYKYYPEAVPPHKYEVLRNVLDYFDGTLDDLCLKFNNEERKPEYLINK